MKISKITKSDILERRARDIRISILQMISNSNSSHIGTAYSVVEILTVLYFSILRIHPDKPTWPNRDRFILSKGHGAAAHYATLAHRGFFPLLYLSGYSKDGGKLHGHTTFGLVPGIEASTGSLGHGLPIGLGMAIAAKRDQKTHRVFVVMGDGDCQEGSNWEAIMAAGNYGLDNLVVIVDYNKMQGLGNTPEIMDLEPFVQKWQAFKWAVHEVDGHNTKELNQMLQSVPFTKGKPSVLIAHTIKGKGVSYMEHNIAWHYRTPLGDDYKQALKELNVL